MWSRRLRFHDDGHNGKEYQRYAKSYGEFVYKDNDRYGRSAWFLGRMKDALIFKTGVTLSQSTAKKLWNENIIV